MAIPTFSLPAPFTVIDAIYNEGFKLALQNVAGQIQSTVSAPLLYLVTLWIIVQSLLIIRGDVDTRHGITKVVTVALVVGLATSSALYHNYVEAFFEVGIPDMVGKIGNTVSMPHVPIPGQLDIIFRAGQAGFLRVSAQIPPQDELDALGFQGAQFFFYFTLWAIFGVYDIIQILTAVLVTIGPLLLLGFLFDATKDITMKWVGQLINYALLFLLVTIVAGIVTDLISIEIVAIVAATLTGHTVPAELIGLYELDFFIMTGNALVVALPGIAASLGGGVAASGLQMSRGFYRQFAGKPNMSTISNMSFIQ